jgi:hypothetical protein
MLCMGRTSQRFFISLLFVITGFILPVPALVGLSYRF